MGSMACARSAWSSLRGVVAAGLIMCCVGAAHAQCVGDCSGDGMVTVSDLIVGVNIALERQPASNCPSLQNDQGKVDVAQLIKGVNNALHGCPATPTVTESTPAATSTETAVVPATETNTPIATATQTSEPSATNTTVIEPTSTPTNTQPSTVTATATSVSTATATATAEPPTATPTLAATFTATAFPVGEAVAGNVALVTSGVGAVQSIITAVIAQVRNPGPGLTEVVVTNGLDVDACPVSGTTSQLCTEMGPSNMHSIHLELGADFCVADGPAGGSAEFNGDITVDSTPGNALFNDCSPVLFIAGTYAANDLSVTFRDSSQQNVLEATANVTGNVNLQTGFPVPACVVTKVTLTLNGELVSRVPSAAQIDVDFHNTQMVMDNITFNSDCVPLQYQLTFNGPATIHSLTTGSTPVDFDVTFTNYKMTQNANVDPPTVSISGSVSSSCFGGQVGLATLVPVATAAGELCPNAGQLSVTQGGAMATVTYGEGGSVMVNQAGKPPQNYLSCIDANLMQCS